MPWINLTVRQGTFTKEMQHAVMARFTDALIFWEKIPDTPEARKKMKGWVYEVAEDANYNGGSPAHKDPFISSKFDFLDELLGRNRQGNNLFVTIGPGSI